MKHLLKTIALCAIFSTSSQAAVSINVVANTATGKYLTSTLGSTATFAYEFGYLDETAYDLLGANQTDYASVDAVFNTLGSGVVNGSGEIFSLGNAVVIPTSPEKPQPGDNLYMWVFNSAVASSATEWGVFSSSTWIMPNDLGIVSLTSSLIDNVVVGGTSGSDFTLASVAPIPEPSTYAALAGLLALGYVVVRRRRA
jgi:hypothetical protein